ncbi:site-2 protease family protein [Nocardioidaceae bacterium]|nr:site-2 protease family protein [Nocardioidaceae bacterium]
MTVLLYVGGVVFLIVTVAISIGLHEAGHMVPAKAFGAKVTQFFVGFGNTVWSFRRGETEYGIKSIPLGGYVKIVGMLPPTEEDREVAGAGERPSGAVKIRQSNTGMFTQLISDARSAEYELVGPDDEDRLFYKLPWWKKVVVMAGGPTVNIVIAFLLFWSVFAVNGVAQSTRTVDVVYDCVIAVVPGQTDQRECEPGDPVTPAVQAGMQPGDRIVGFNGTDVESWEQLQTLIRDNGDAQAEIEVLRDGEPRTLTTATTVNAVVDLGDASRTVEAGYLGVTPEQVVVSEGPVFTAVQMYDYTERTVEVLATLPVKLYHVGLAVIGVEERAADSPMSVVGASRVAGELSSNTEVPVSDRFFSLLALLAGINLFVGVFNFIPLLPLDGGHIAGALYEAVRRRWALLRGRPDPGHFDVAKLLPVAYVVAGGLIVMSVLLMVADLVAPVRIT